MFSSFISLKKLISILEIKDSYLFFLIFIFLISSLVDLLSLSLIAPLITAFVNPIDIYSYKYLQNLKNYEIETVIFFLFYLYFF